MHTSSPIDAVNDAVRPLHDAAGEAALFFDVDGTLAPITTRAQESSVPAEISQLLAKLVPHYALVACVSGRNAAEARRLVGVGSISYSGLHGAELLRPGSSVPEVESGVERYERQVAAFARGWDRPELRAARVRIEDKRLIWAFHWRGAHDEEAAEAIVKRIAIDAEEAGLAIHWGRKVLEVRPPVDFGKGQVVSKLLDESGCIHALYAGDDSTDVDAFEAIRSATGDQRLATGLCIAVASAESPSALIEQADLIITGTAGVLTLLRTLAAFETAAG